MATSSGAADQQTDRENPHAPTLAAAREGVRRAAGRIDPHGTEQAGDEREHGADLAGAEPVPAHEEGRKPEHQRVARESAAGSPEDDQRQHPIREQEAQSLGEGWRRTARYQPFRRAPDRLAHREAHQQRDEEPGQADDEEGLAPAHQLVDPAADQEPEQHADAHALTEDAHGRRPFMRRVQVRDDRVRGGVRAGLAHPTPTRAISSCQ